MIFFSGMLHFWNHQLEGFQKSIGLPMLSPKNAEMVFWALKWIAWSSCHPYTHPYTTALRKRQSNQQLKNNEIISRTMSWLKFEHHFPVVLMQPRTGEGFEHEAIEGSAPLQSLWSDEDFWEPVLWNLIPFFLPAITISRTSTLYVSDCKNKIQPKSSAKNNDNPLNSLISSTHIILFAPLCPPQ